MSHRRPKIRVGTSGWHYDDWKGRFYPPGLKKADWLTFYMENFDTVEINNSFYHLPSEKTFENWRAQAKRNFLFTVKANRYITHIKKLSDPAETLEKFFARTSLLENNLGPVLYQLPPNMSLNIERLGEFISHLPKKNLSAFEFRNKSWYTDEIFSLLDKNGISLCVHDLGDKAPPKIVTGKLLYLRLHGSKSHHGKYSNRELSNWAKWVQENAGRRDSYIYFNNDYHGFAVDNAFQIREMLK